MKHKFITIGEIMLRLTPPDYEKIRTATSFEARYGGSEANVALSLANLGVDASFFTVVPGNSLGKSAVRMMRSNDVNCDSVIYSVYDRKHSAFSEYDFSKTDVKKLLEGYTWLHLSGITPALGKSCSELILTCLKTAKANGMTVSFDGNFRSTLWSWEEARDFCTLCLPYIDVLFGIEPYHIWKNEKDHGAGDVKDGIPFQPDRDQQEKVFKAFVKRYPNIKCIARHVRFAHSCSENSLSSYLWLNGKTYESKRLTFHILDRVGGGDAFVSGIIYALMNEYTPEDIVNFGVAASAVKHTIHGDGNITDDVSLIRHVMEMNFDIKR